MPHPLESSFAKTDRAKEHFKQLNSVMSRFGKSCPYTIAIKNDPQTGQLLYYLKKASPIPSEVSLLVGDIIQNLRSALDHLAYQLVVKDTSGMGH